MKDLYYLKRIQSKLVQSNNECTVLWQTITYISFSILDYKTTQIKLTVENLYLRLIDILIVLKLLETSFENILLNFVHIKNQLIFGKTSNLLLSGSEVDV